MAKRKSSNTGRWFKRKIKRKAGFITGYGQRGLTGAIKRDFWSALFG